MKRGRRDNGLDATAYVPLRDVDPRVGEHLLDLLYAAGIAAYLEPTSDTDSYTRAVSLPSPPSDRLFVDRGSRQAAQSLVASAQQGEDEEGRSVAGADRRARRGGGPSDDEAGRRQAAEDAAFAAIVAAWDRSPEPDFVDPEEHYVPPAPPPVPRLTQASLAALVCIAVGAMLLVAPGVLDLGRDVSFVLGVFGIVGGVGMLVFRMRERPPFDEDPDDGAVV